jgi:serine/threonine-protein kinase
MKKIGRYIIRGLLGRGGMGRIYKVELPVVARIAALKLLDPDPLLAKLMGKSRLQERFIDEARTMAGLQHPNIVAINDFDLHDGRPFYVMDFFANNLGTLIGESYRTEDPSRRINTDKALNYIGQTLKGLACMHAAGIIHRDIKPFNLLVTALDEIKICDFGLSKKRGEIYQGPSNLNVGTPYYAAPEQERDPDSAGPSADLYSTGIVLYRLVTGRLPEGHSRGKAYLPPSRINSDLNQVWDDFIARAITKHPGERFADALEMSAALANLCRHWQQQKEHTCALAPTPEPPTRETLKETHCLRTEPVKVPPRQALSYFQLDKLWRPQTYSASRLSTTNNGLLLDQTTGLVWQQAGSPYPGSWNKAHAYIRMLNQKAHGGLTAWRLPTIEELATLLRPPSQGTDLCLPTLFEPTQRWLWSIDRRSFAAAYYADAELGFVGWQDMSAPYYVRAVCSA